MLRLLRITNLAVIDSAEVEFGPGLNVLTGETGAGKSILIGAIGLLLGDRASADLLRTGETTATIEAIFETGGGEELLLRREITSQGRSRAFINGTLATATVLRDTASRFVEIHGQHEHHTLLAPESHLALVDAFGGLGAHVAAVEELHAGWLRASKNLAAARTSAGDRAQRADLLRFQLAELDRASLRASAPNEDEELSATRKVLFNAERVRTLCAEAYASLYDKEDSALGTLAGVWRRVAELATVDSTFIPRLAERDAVKSQLEDLAAMLRDYGNDLDTSPERLQSVEDRLALLDRTKRKYGPTLADCIRRHDTIRGELAALDGGEEHLASLERALAEARGEIARLVVTTTERVLAKKLSDADRAAYNDTAARELANV